MNRPVSDAPSRPPPSRMKAVRVRAFGGVDVLNYEDVPCPEPGPGQVLIRVAAAGVGPWDAWVREGKSAVPQKLPLIPGSDLSGVIERIGPGVGEWQHGEAVFGVTNAGFTGAYAEYALADAAMIARKPPALGDIEAASLPVVASTAWQMVFDHAQVRAGQRILVLGGAGNVGAYAVQLASQAGAHVAATVRANQRDYVCSLGAAEAIDAADGPPAEYADAFEVVIDTVGGAALSGSFALLKPRGVLVSAVAEPDEDLARRRGVRAVFFLVNVTTAGLDRIAQLIGAGKLIPQIGEVLPLSQARLAHEMLAGRPHKPGKIVLLPNA